MTTRFGLIWAQARGGVIGADGGMPWHVPEDLRHFKELTINTPVVMGRRTWDSFPARFRPLPDRRNIVVTRNDEWAGEGAERADSLDSALDAAREQGSPWAWVIGGSQLFSDALAHASRLEVTELDLDVAGDTFAPAVDGWRVAAVEPAHGWHTSSSGIRYRFLTYEPEGS
ncbi:dihydrofolate reductase [Microbacterium sp. C7(2022)]|uniref:dihydrofolate reductase n=1 Tax=Microbacterium sp. C7(2022) TaxID=2992759 RepID=UPI00237B46F6|nr:dihydrofolate reductase [Microbacterium sp. C7(2022)]MDE0545906.1 dihydrofolate reductase [Microbacterium sp. C7(2022)]